jgi:hypothetical protein
MKNLTILLFLISQLISFESFCATPTSVGSNIPIEITVTVTIGGEIGIKSKGCRGLGVSCLEIGLDYDVNIVRFGKAPAGSAIMQFDVLKSGEVRMTFFSNNTGDFELDANSSLGPKISKLLGYKDIILTKGVYSSSKRADGAYVVTTKASFLK